MPIVTGGSIFNPCLGHKPRSVRLASASYSASQGLTDKIAEAVTN